MKKDNLLSFISIDQELHQIQDLDLLLERTLIEARRMVSADAGSIYIRDQGDKGEGEKKERLAIKYSQNDTLQKALPQGQRLIYSVFSIPIDEKTISGYCALTGQLINVPDVYHLPLDAPYSFNTSYDLTSGYKTTSVLVVPLKTVEGRLFGVIQMINSKNEAGETVPFSQEAEMLITHFAVNATYALQRAHLTRTMILRMIKMSELRDPKETGPHVNRVAGYAVEIYDHWAGRRGIPFRERDTFRDSLRIAAMLHDVGKVAISDSILKKPGRFTKEEYAVIQQHTIYGAQLFSSLESPLDSISRDIALTHHENWDGTGYPSTLEKNMGLSGEEIPLAGRLVAIADVFDALCSKRVYKEAWDESAVLEEIRSLGGKKFDPELVDIFFEAFPNIKQVQNLYPE